MRWLSGMAIAACAVLASGCEKSSKDEVAKRPPPPVKRIDAAPVRVIDAAPTPVADAAVVGDASVVVASCTGAAINLSAVFADKRCDTAKPATYAPPKQLAITVVGPMRVKAGNGYDLAVKLKNTSAAAMDLVFEHRTWRGTTGGQPSDKADHYTGGFYGKTYDPSGRLMQVIASVSSASGLSLFKSTFSRIRLAPGGVATGKIRWHAKYHSTSVRHAGSDLKPGAYDVRVALPWPGRPREPTRKPKPGWTVSHRLTVTK